MPRSRWLRRSLLLLMLLLLLAATLLLYARYWLAQQGVSRLDWQGLQLDSRQLQLDTLQLQQQDPLSGRQLAVQLKGLQLQWQPGTLQRLHVDQLQIQLLEPGQSATEPEDSNAQAAFDWLPLQLELPAIELEIPCPAGRCRLQGSLQVQRTAAALLPASLQLALRDAGHSASLQAWLDGPIEMARLRARLQLDQHDWLQLSGQRRSLGGPLQLTGQLQLPARPPAPWLADWLRPWSADSARALQQLPDTLQLSGNWQVNLQQDARGNWQLPRFSLDLQAQLPTWQQGALQLQDSRLQLALHGLWQTDRLAIQFAGDSKLNIRQLGWNGVQLQDVQLQANELQLRQTGSPLQAVASLHLTAASLQHPRGALDGIDLQLQARLDHDQLQLRIPQLTVSQLNPGLPMGPLRFSGNYQAALDQLAHGRLRIDQLETAVLGGRLRLLPGQLDLADTRQQLAIAAYELDVAELLRRYPAEGLHGSGRLDGYLPLQLAPEGVQVSGGQLVARAPGGSLQIRPPGLAALGHGNPAMQLLASALHDFRYSKLSCRLELASSGKLQLALQLSGHNPALEHGRVVNLNVNLEEDLPALLTSLQLSGRVQDAIRQRLQQQLQPRP